MPPRALVFDFDGLLIDTESPEVEVWREVWREHGLEFPDAIWIHCIGRGAEQIEETPIQALGRLGPSHLDLPSIKADHHDRVMARINSLPPRPGILALLDRARAQGIPIGVASSSKHAWVDGHLTRLGLLDRFVATTCADDVERAKPFPDLYLLACQRLGVDPSEALALEDSPHGIAAARAAGLRVIAYPNPLTRLLDISAADEIVESLDGILR